MTIGSESEELFGILCYGTSFNGIGGTIKQYPEDFVVAEVLKEESKNLISRENGKYPLFILAKKRADTLETKILLEKLIGMSVNILGLKDKNATTYQFVSGRKKETVREKIERKCFTAIRTAYTLKPLTRADLFGNSFKIKLRNAEHNSDAITSLRRDLEQGRVPNYYGPQRFGEKLSNHIIGRHIVKRNFDEAAKLIFGNNTPKDDSISSLRTLPIELRRLYVSSYQSYLFNLCISRVLQKKSLDKGGLYVRFHKSEVKVDLEIRFDPLINDEVTSVRLCPLPGYSFRERNDVLFQTMKEVLHDEGITPSQFYVKDMQEVSVEGGLRPFSMIGWLRGWYIDDIITLNFILYSGSYATVLLRELTKVTIQN